MSSFLYIIVSIIAVIILLGRLSYLQAQLHKIKIEFHKLENIMPIIAMMPLSEQARKIYHTLEDREKIYKEAMDKYYRLELKEMEQFLKKEPKMATPFIPSNEVIKLRKELAEEISLLEAAQKWPGIYHQKFINVMNGKVPLIHAQDEINKLLPPYLGALIPDKDSVDKLLEEWSFKWDNMTLDKRLAMAKEIIEGRT